MMKIISPIASPATESVTQLDHEPTSGNATICGHDLRSDLIEVKRNVGFVPESGAVFESLTGLEYLEMVAALHGIPQNAARARIKQFIAFFDLSFETLTDKLLGAYSKGMRRKVVITSALLHNPPVVFFDEPLDGLDANAAVGFKTLIQTLAREGKTIVYSSHILDVVERVCHRVIIIDKGRIFFDGPLSAIIDRFATHKILALSFEDGAACDFSAFGEVVERTPDTVRLRIPRSGVTEACRAIAQRRRVTLLKISKKEII